MITLQDLTKALDMCSDFGDIAMILTRHEVIDEAVVEAVPPSIQIVIPSLGFTYVVDIHARLAQRRADLLKDTLDAHRVSL